MSGVQKQSGGLVCALKSGAGTQAVGPPGEVRWYRAPAFLQLFKTILLYILHGSKL